MGTTFDEPDSALREVFGYEEFRPSQRRVIDGVLEGSDLLTIMPTGSGKSLCYQLPAVLLDGTVLVVSPLIALMSDQLEGLRDKGVAATLINSSLSRRERRRRTEAMTTGEYDVVYVAPERFRSDRFSTAIESADVALLAVDEAHCISQWGHDFRPDYLALGEARERLGEPTVLGLTATATRRVRRDIVDQLGVPEAEIVVGGFERPNLHFEVSDAIGERAKMERLTALLDRRPSASSVVYCATRRQVDDVAEQLKNRDFVVGAYHAGLSQRRRNRIQEAFMADDLPILVATNAFGMGVDKSDIRSIFHYNVTGSLEAYYQQAGRAGRDGDPAHCMLLYDPSDRGIHDFFIDNSHPKKEVVQALWRVLSDEGVGRHELSPELLAEHVSRKGGGFDVHRWAIETSLKLLRKGGHVTFEWRNNRHWVEVLDRSRIRDLRVDWQRLEQRRDVAEEQLEDVLTYARGSGCRTSYLLHYFGASPSFGDQCGRCDNCRGKPLEPSVSNHRDEPADSPRTIVQKILSGAARARGSATLLPLASMLRGSKGSYLEGSIPTDVSTHGILGWMSQHELVQMIRSCIEADLLVRKRDKQLALTERGVEVMKGEAPVPPSLEQRIEVED